MKYYSNIVASVVMMGLISFGQACAPSATSKPANPSPQASGAESSSSATAGAGQGGRTQESGLGKSSLDDLRSGKSSVTPGSSPLKDVLFQFDRYDLSADARAVLRVNADWLRINPAVRVEIEGHCDERGTGAYNLVLGERRAQAVRKYLLDLGVPSSQIKITSYGKERPFCTEHSEDCWQSNRRAHFTRR